MKLSLAGVFIISAFSAVSFAQDSYTLHLTLEQNEDCAPVVPSADQNKAIQKAKKLLKTSFSGQGVYCGSPAKHGNPRHQTEDIKNGRVSYIDISDDKNPSVMLCRVSRDPDQETCSKVEANGKPDSRKKAANSGE